MDKKYIIILIVVLVGCGALFLYVRDKNTKDAAKHAVQEYSRRIKAAKKSPSAGLRQMGQALNRYRDDNGAYPSKLSELYPDYIPVKEFIDDIEWHYSPKEGDFLLRKSVEGPGKKVLTASIRSDLQPAPESGKMAASSGTPISPQSKPEAEPSTEESTERMIVASTTMSSPILKPVLPEQNIEQHQKADEPQDFQDDPESSNPESVPLPTYQLSEKTEFIKRLRDGVLVWKNEDGTLGFGNIQYPLDEELTIYDGGEWVQIRRRKPQLAFSDAGLQR